jgi:hypothetical protein
MTASSLVAYDVDPQGMYVRMRIYDESGTPATLVFPIQCLTQLMMTLPKMISTALQNRHGDNTLRLVHALDQFTIESGEVGGNGEHKLILTLGTSDGFSVSFSATQESFGTLGGAIANDVEPIERPRELSRLS